MSLCDDCSPYCDHDFCDGCSICHLCGALAGSPAAPAVPVMPYNRQPNMTIDTPVMVPAAFDENAYLRYTSRMRAGSTVVHLH